ncbi:MAG: membrane protein insertase YidC [Oscillospiraceae bacterium]|nr:membrane protein insertase YidC [Oscillospiraceae bacterium]
MDAVYRILGLPLGYVMWACYQIVNNYGLALFVFTLIIRAILFPLSLKQQKSTIKMQLLKPQMDELQAKYKNNREKLNEEMMKLYQKEGYNPASGCLPLLIQMPILFGLIEVIYRPLKHILHLPADIIINLETIAQSLHPDKIRNLGGLNSAQITVIQDVQAGNAAYNAAGAGIVRQISDFKLDFFGMNLGEIPQLGMFGDILSGIWNPVLLIPIISGISALLVSVISMRVMPSTENTGANASMKGMMYTMPIFSLFIAFQVPAGVGLYWCYSNLFAMAQSLILNKYYNPKEMAEKARAEHAERQEQERLERIEAKKRAKEKGEETEQKSMSQKEINRRKLAEARKRDAERYGETYVEVTDEDLR